MTHDDTKARIRFDDIVLTDNERISSIKEFYSYMRSIHFSYN